jgi:hypothetical protein
MANGAADRLETPLMNLKQAGQVDVDGVKKEQSKLVNIFMVGVK